MVLAFFQALTRPKKTVRRKVKKMMMIPKATDESKSTYGNIRCTDFASGDVFDSKLEYERWKYLKAVERTGKISNLQRQVKVPIIINGIEVSHARIDHVYESGGVTVYEETKGYLNDVQRLRYRILKAQGLNLKFHPPLKL